MGDACNFTALLRPSQTMNPRVLATVGCGILLAIFATLSWTAVIGKSATADEPLHSLAAYMRLFHHDFRLNPEDPPLWGYWAMLPQHASSLQVDQSLPQWARLTDYMWDQPKFVTQTLYRTPGNDPIAFINRSRAMMLIIGVGLGALITLWAWQIAGPGAGVMACVLFCFDPNFAGHAPLVKDDVPITLALLLLCWSTWNLFKRPTWPWLLAVALSVGVGLTVKFSGVLFVPILLALLLARRALLRQRPSNAAGKKPLATNSLIIFFTCASMSLLLIWSCYGFRHAATPDPSVKLNMTSMVQSVTWTKLIAESPTHTPPSPRELSATSPPLIASLIARMDSLGLLPQAWCAGFLDTYRTTLYGSSFLLAEIRHTGWWYYFPLAMLFKTPTATLVAALVVLIAFPLYPKYKGQAAWTAACIALPPTLFLLVAMTSHLNLGLRHILPIYPFVFIAIAVVLCQFWRRGAAAKVSLLLLTLGLLTENLHAYPNYIAFFNLPAGGTRGGERLLGDSNLDWGQDLPLLQRWQQQHADTKLYLSYFGMADPGYYVKYTPLIGNAGGLGEPQTPHEPGVLALSANTLQGTYLQPGERAFYHKLIGNQQPFEVLGGSIYLFKFGN